MKVRFKVSNRNSSSDMNGTFSIKSPLTSRKQSPLSKFPQCKSTKNVINSNKTVKFQQFTKKFSKLLDVRENLMKQYNSLLKMYETNEWKLFKIIQNELSSNNYLYCKQVLSFIKNPQIQTVRSLKLDLFENDLKKITRFMTEFNTKKRIRQVQIIKQSMTNRQKMIRKSADDREYYQIYRKMRSPNKVNHGFTIYDQFQGILQNHNATSEKSKVHEQLFVKICDAEESVYNLVKEVAETNQRKKTFQKFRHSIDRLF